MNATRTVIDPQDSKMSYPLHDRGTDRLLAAIEREPAHPCPRCHGPMTYCPSEIDGQDADGNEPKGGEA